MDDQPLPPLGRRRRADPDLPFLRSVLHDLSTPDPPVLALAPAVVELAVAPAEDEFVPLWPAPPEAESRERLAAFVVEWSIADDDRPLPKKG